MSEPLKIDEKQLEDILKSFRPSRSTKLSLQQYLSILQVATILVGGLWALNEYVSFRREYENLQLKQHQFIVDQQNITREQQKLALEMAKLSISANKVSNMAAELDLRRKSEERIVTHKNELTVTELRHFDDGSRLYKASVDLEVENNGDNEFEISYTVTQFFIGSTTKDVPNPGIIHFNGPPDVFNFKAPGCVKWDKVGQYSSRYGSSNHDMTAFFKFLDCEPVDSGGGLCAHLRKAEKTSFEYTYLVRAKPDNLIAFVTNIGIDGATSGRNVWFFKNWEFLHEVERQKDLTKD